VARAVLADRPVLLLDEPTSHLDAATAEAVLSTVLSRSAGRSVLWVTHRPEELARFPARCRIVTGPGRYSHLHHRPA
jgi:ABC-type transport system involved in cytochrome bd biosynthesis fused ATPase/permease subunit